ncbi:SEC59/DGK1/VTE5 family protein [Ancylothrix sp. C2]|uniref:diacylglycerol/polyprenol kinase family protein n=1 Tax=Ancylothrix sp. D3o TaxID=2953691 RepID=UPI0021BAABBB|nr:diacylglycerol/polyprenol kinase family protein [Ancylothrix sp. D3o]MCT7948407.1 SEC59/DGK1/VTE5 family protein [Ancylothrix sp. D3o]
MNELLPDSLTSNLWVQISLVAVWLGGILLIAESLNRFAGTDSEITRKIVHIGTGNVILFAWFLNIPAWVGIGAAILAAIVTLISYRFPILPGVNSIGRQSFGTFFYALSIGLLIAWFWPQGKPEYAAIGILIMTYGDGLAAIIGQRFGRNKYEVFGSKKSLQGTLTMTIISFLVCGLILLTVQGNIPPTWLVAAAVALTATGLETFSKYGIDNLTVPLGSATIAYFLNLALLAHFSGF